VAAGKEIHTTQIRSCVGYLTQVRGDELNVKDLRRVGSTEVSYHKCDAGHLGCWVATGKDQIRASRKLFLAGADIRFGSQADNCGARARVR
jgi:hypothetical protein